MIKNRIFWSIFGVTASSIILVSIFTISVLYYETTKNTWSNLISNVNYLSIIIKKDKNTFYSNAKNNPYRLTLVSHDGTVLFDNKKEISTMSNHKNRPEIIEAIKSGYAKSQRISDTLKQRTLYFALRLEDGNILRISIDKNSIFLEIFNFLPIILIFILALLVVTIFVVKIQTNKILEPILNIDLNNPNKKDNYAELIPLLKQIDIQKHQIMKQMMELQAKQNEFSIVTKNMDEGLIVINKDGLILNMNKSAKKILNVKKSEFVNLHILDINQNKSLKDVIKISIDGKKVKQNININGRIYQISASPSYLNSELQGVVMILLDETEKVLLEQKRQEFSANVSHELKTPLTSILGYAEIISTGLAKQEDVRGFASNIHDEASRLITLIEDIIKLSRLDEKAVVPQKTSFNIYKLAKDNIKSLENKASQKGINIILKGDEIDIVGVKSMIGEIFYNLIDNAISYTYHGSIIVKIKDKMDKVLVEIKDDGIGIAIEHQKNIFERFYRVDKSHSKASGGTGLGLAIVKRSVLYHNGKIRLKSKEGEGSVFIFELPKEG